MPNFRLKSSTGESYTLTDSLVRLGRSRDNDIVVTDPAVSRHHVNFYVKENSIVVEDAGSQNGFLVNGKAIQGPSPVNTGDRLFIGSREYLIEDRHKEAPPELKLEAMPPPREPPPPPMPKATRPSAMPLWIIGGIGLLVMFVVIYQSEPPDTTPARSPASTKDSATQALVSDGYRNDNFRSRSLTEVHAEAKFRESMRDYDNGNYSRAILGFNEALTFNPAHAGASEYLQLSENLLKTQLDELMKDGEKSASPNIMQYHRSKTEMAQILTILAEQIPGYGRKVATEASNVAASQSVEQEENLLKIPCEQTKNAVLCKRAVDLLKSCRQKLGEEDYLK